jgi:hybrid polyketide synthase/nonribosomal peptide synthetase ACE1
LGENELTSVASFFLKLQVSLQLQADQDRAQVLSSNTDDLGVDSLVAVEIRSWFLKEVETEIPVFKILSGGSISELVEFAVENMPAKLTPNLGDSANALEPDALVTIQVIPADNASSVPTTNEPKSNSTEGSEHDKEIATPATANSILDIPKASFEKIIPISPGQSRFWFLKHLIDDQTTANSTICVSIKGTILPDSLETAVQEVANRHESLRTSFMDEDRRPVQAISESSRLYLERISISSESQVTKEFDSLKKHVYDIEHGDCMRLIYLTMTPTESYLLIGSHHIIMDGISLEVFLSDLQKAYNGQKFDEPVYQYSDYSEKLRQDLARGAMQEELDYWKTELASPPEALPLLPFAATNSRTSLSTYESTSLSRTIRPGLARQIENTCRERKANASHFYLGVFEVLLFKLFGKSDVCIGMADANRTNDQDAKSIGMYLNLLPLRFQLESNQTFDSVLKDTRKKAYLALANSKLPFDVLLDNVQSERSTTFSPLFQAFINYRQGVSEIRRFDSATGSVQQMSMPGASYDISLDIIENPGHDTRIIFMLQKSLYTDGDTDRVLDMYFKLLGDLSGSSKRALKDVSLYSELEISNAIQLGRGNSFVSTVLS